MEDGILQLVEDRITTEKLSKGIWARISRNNNESYITVVGKISSSQSMKS